MTPKQKKKNFWSIRDNSSSRYYFFFFFFKIHILSSLLLKKLNRKRFTEDQNSHYPDIYGQGRGVVKVFQTVFLLNVKPS